MDCIVHGVTKSWTQLSDFHSKLWTLDDKDVSMQVHQLQQIYHSDEDMNKEGGYECAVAGVILEISESFIKFCCESNMALKNKVHSKQKQI